MTWNLIYKNYLNWIKNGFINTITNPMAIKQAEIEKLLKEGFPDADIEIQDLAGDDNHFSAKIKSSQFKGKNRVQQHQMVYKALKGKMGASVFLGGSIVNKGGQNPLEASRLGAKIFHGPDTSNFKDVYKLLSLPLALDLDDKLNFSLNLILSSFFFEIL